MKKIAVLVSGGGSNLQALIDSGIKIECVISNNANAFGIERAKKHNIEAIFFDSKAKTRLEYTQELTKMLISKNIDLVCLAGFMLILDKSIFEIFDGRMLNIHPALLPKYGGIGMYGMHVHRAVFASGDKVSGATVHIVTQGCDEGLIVLQEKVDILDCSTPEEIAKKVLKVEHKIYPEAVRKFLKK